MDKLYLFVMKEFMESGIDFKSIPRAELIETCNLYKGFSSTEYSFIIKQVVNEIYGAQTV